MPRQESRAFLDRRDKAVRHSLAPYVFQQQIQRALPFVITDLCGDGVIRHDARVTLGE